MTLLKQPVTFTANRLSDGEVVWLGKGGKWVETVDVAIALKTQDERDAAARIAAKADADNHVVEPYEIDVELVSGRVVPVKFREQIRAAGPTIRLDLGKQSARHERAA